VEGVGAVGLSAPCCMGGLRLSLELIRRTVISDEALYYYFLLSYPIMVESVLAGIGVCGRCWCCRPFRPLLCGGISGRAVISDEALHYYFLLSYLIMLAFELVGLVGALLINI
jgi:hypothetical protein